MVTLKVKDIEPISLSAQDEPAKDLDAGLTTVVAENNYNDLRNKPQIEGIALEGNKSLNDLQGYTQDQIDSKLSAKANKADVPSLKGYATEAWVEAKKYASTDDFYTKGQTDDLLTLKADKSEIPSLNGYATQKWVEDKHYLTQHQSLDGYATEQWVEDKGYLTQHQSLDGYYTKTEVTNLLKGKADAGAMPKKVSDLTNDSGFITLADLPVYDGSAV